MKPRMENVYLKMVKPSEDNMLKITTDGERIFEDGEGGATIYNLTREYEITKNGLRRWKKDGGRVRAYYYPAGKVLDQGYVDDSEAESAVVFSKNIR